MTVNLAYIRDPLEDDFSVNYLRTISGHDLLFNKNATHNRFKYLKIIKEITKEISLHKYGMHMNIDIDTDDKLFIEKIYFVDIKYKISILFKFIIRLKNVILTDKIIIPSINKIYEIINLDTKIESIHNKFLNSLNISFKNQDTVKYFANSFEENFTINSLQRIWKILIHFKDILFSSQDIMISTDDLYEFISKNIDMYSNLDMRQLNRCFDSIDLFMYDYIGLDLELTNVLNKKYKSLNNILFGLNSNNFIYTNSLINSSCLNLDSSANLYDYTDMDFGSDLTEHIVKLSFNHINTDFSFYYCNNSKIITSNCHVNRYDEFGRGENMTNEFNYLPDTYTPLDSFDMNVGKSFNDIIAFNIDFYTGYGNTVEYSTNTVLDLNTCSLFSNSLINVND